MAQPVWVLSVDLQTKTATFTTGLADAARSARGSFTDIKNSSKEMGEGVAQSGQNVRAAVGLIDNTIRGAHAMAMADLVREFSQTRIVMAALPFAATVAGFVAVAGIVVEGAMKIKEMREEHEKLALEQTRFGTTVQESFNSLDEKLIQAEKRTDELRNDHIGALHKELELINKQSFADLVKEFGVIEKAADEVFKHLEGHWYTFGIGSTGAQHALDVFSAQYKSLLSQSKDKEAGDLLAGTLASAEKVLAAQKMVGSGKTGSANTDADWAQRLKYMQASDVLSRAGVSSAQKDIEAQEQLVTALRMQGQAHEKIAAITKQEAHNATTQTGNEGSARQSEAARQLAASQLAINEQKLTADRAAANAELEIQRATVEAKLQSDIAFAQRDMQVKLAGNAAEAAALDKAGKDYANQLQNLRNKALEIEQQHATAVAELKARAAVEQNKRDIANLEAGARANIQATTEGSAARLAAIEAATRTVEQWGLQETDFYRTLGTERVEVERQIADQTAKIKADLGKEAAEHTSKMGQLELAAVLETQSWLNSARRVSDAEAVAQQLAASEMEFHLKQQALQQQIAALDTGNKEYEVKLKTLQDRELELIREHEDQKTAIMDSAEIQRNQSIASSYMQFASIASQGLTSVLMRHQSFASMVTNLGNQVISGMMQNAIKSVMIDNFDKESKAAKAARTAFNIGLEMGGPAGFILGPVFGAAAFASVMAFNQGGIVPGVGRGDVVPAMLTPGEAVLPKAMVERLSASTGNGESSGPTYHLHVRPTYNVQTIDGNGMEDALNKHTDVLQKHFRDALRKMNVRV